MAIQTINNLMQKSAVRFGTSGARGLADKITDLIAYAYTRAFLQYLAEISNAEKPFETVAISGDLRPSTERIMIAAGKAAADMGYQLVNCGRVPSPALAYYGLEKEIPTVMVTGSHIPEDRNGIKYTTPKGEISKKDEAGIIEQTVEIPKTLFYESGAFKTKAKPLAVDKAATILYAERYLKAFPKTFLKGKRLGFYQHSAVGRDLLVEIYRKLGAEVTLFGREESFVPVDTEAIREEDHELAREWAIEENFDAILSTDGDSDRPLISDEHGRWIRGDVSGILTAFYLGAEGVVAPVSCNTALEKSGFFATTLRTKIGSPYVISGIEELHESDVIHPVGYEANGGFLIGANIELKGGTLKALPTRDAAIVHLSLLGLSKAKNKPLSRLVEELPQRFGASGRLTNFSTKKSQKIVEQLVTKDAHGDYSEIAAKLETPFGKCEKVNTTDGVRLTFENGEIVHFRPSGNAPEFRCYTEADSEARAEEILAEALALIQKL